MAEKKLSEELRHCLDGDGCKIFNNNLVESFKMECAGE